MRSLFIVSLPRSLSSRVFHLAREALGLAEPAWTSDGEVLNLDRYALFAEAGAAHPRYQSLKLTSRRWEPERFERVLALLAKVVEPADHAYKDVVQPFATAEWLPGADLAVLKIERPVEDVAYAMLERGWAYPRVASKGWPEVESEVVEGLVRARDALAGVPGRAVSFDDLIASEGVLAEALRDLYPEVPLAVAPYIDTDFIEERQRILARRESALYARLAERVREVEAGLASEP